MVADDDPIRPEDTTRQDVTPPSPVAAVPPAMTTVPSPTSIRPEPVRPRSEPSPSALRTVVLPCLLGIIGGAAGAYGLLRFGGPIVPAPASTKAETSSESPGSPPSAPAPPANIATIETRVDELRGHVEQVEKRLDKIHDPTPDLDDLRTKLTEMIKSGDAGDASADDLKTLEGHVSGLDQSLKALRGEVLVLQTASKPKPNPNPSPAPTAGPRPADVDVEDEAFGQAVDLFRKGKYKDALARFEKLDASHPDDARVWYYAALSNGFATGHWDGRSVELVNKGIERERAGSPTAAEIDATFRDLTTANGKDWLAVYRQRARPK